MIRRPLVLVAIDHATDLERTMDVALSTAKERAADLHVISVVPHGAVEIVGDPGRWAPDPPDERRADIATRIASMIRSADHDGARGHSVTLRGEPEQVIPAYAQLHEAALLVVERDYGSSRFWRNGRVVNDLARRSPAPLLVLPTSQGAQRGRPGLRRILAPFDFSIASGVALKTAVDLARRHGAHVTLLHAMTNVPQRMVFSGSEALRLVRQLPAHVQAVTKRLRRRAAVVGANDVETEVVTGVADRAILTIATRSDTDLVVMGVARRSCLDRLLFGSTLRRVLRRATVPVLVVPVVAGAFTWRDEPVVEAG